MSAALELRVVVLAREWREARKAVIDRAVRGEEIGDAALFRLGRAEADLTAAVDALPGEG